MASRLRLLQPTRDAPPDVPKDAELAQRLAQGDHRAAVLLWRSHSVMVRGLIVRTLGSSAEVEDLVQQVFFVFFRKLPTLRDPSALRAFLFGITIREVRSELRRRRVRKWLQLTSGGDLANYHAPEDDKARYAFAQLRRLLDSLDTRGHLAFVLRHFEGYELVEVAEALSCSLATVKRVLSAVETKIWALAADDPSLAPYLEPTNAEDPHGSR
jgi:RNA polymerase sigma-70 factor (ECF subfamily)